MFDDHHRDPPFGSQEPEETLKGSKLLSSEWIPRESPPTCHSEVPEDFNAIYGYRKQVQPS